MILSDKIEDDTRYILDLSIFTIDQFMFRMTDITSCNISIDDPSMYLQFSAKEKQNCIIMQKFLCELNTPWNDDKDVKLSVYHIVNSGCVNQRTINVRGWYHPSKSMLDRIIINGVRQEYSLCEFAELVMFNGESIVSSINSQQVTSVCADIRCNNFVYRTDDALCCDSLHISYVDDTHDERRHTLAHNAVSSNVLTNLNITSYVHDHVNVNKNGRIYPREIFDREIHRYMDMLATSDNASNESDYVVNDRILHNSNSEILNAPTDISSSDELYIFKTKILK